MTSHGTHPIAAPWRGAVHFWPRIVVRAPDRIGPPGFRVRGGRVATLALLAGWALLWALFIVAVS